MGKLSSSSPFVLALIFVVIAQLSFYQVSTMSCIQEEREALLKFKASFIDPLKRLISWKGTDCCNWYGVGCNETSGYVTKLDLRNYQANFSTALLSNGVDSSLSKLKYLNYLDLSGNFFNYSQIPDLFLSMLELRYLNLSHTYFYGRIPHDLGNLTNLLVLDFQANNYYYWHGVSFINSTMLFIDDAQWILGLSFLQYLDLSGVNLQHTLNLMQILNALPFLSSLKLSDCGLQKIHLSYVSLNSLFLPRIQLLDLSSNMFDCALPKAFQNMTSLRFLYLSYSGFTSSIPLWLGNLRNLVILDLQANLFTSIEVGLSTIIANNCHLKKFVLSYNNFLRGDVFGSHGNLSASCKGYDLEVLHLENIQFGAYKIPDWLGQLTNLKFLHLSNNTLYGPIPASLGNLSSIESLDISYNILSGGIPTSFGRLLNLIYLNLRENNLDGIIPESFGQLQSLRTIDLSKNSLKGVVLENHFVNISRLEVLFLTGNSLLSFEIKPDWVPPFQLKLLSMRSIKGFRSTRFPRWLETQKEIVSLDLFNTSISGPIPIWLRGQNLHFLDLSYNQISGSLPKSISNQMPNLIGLVISNARINGSLPQSICKLNIMLFALPNNRLSGTIPSCLLTPNLSLLDLSSNEFSGVFPSQSLNLLSLEVMHLANNKLTGEPLNALRNCKGLSILDLEGNQFSGNIPAWVGVNLGNLQILNLRGNMFNGTIPASMWLLPHLQILVLADNTLVGNIPPNVGNFSRRPIDNDGVICSLEEDPYAFCYVNYVSQVIKSLDLNYSYLQLYSMVNIDLSNNNLDGLIPSEITSIKSLVGLNLSHNNLSGPIPVEIGRTKSLESLDLSFNRLSGPIPDSMSNLNSLGVLKLSNNNLSGHIPREGHLSTFNDASSYEGNPYLCGDPLPKKCINENSRKSPIQIDSVDDYNSHKGNKWEKMCFYIIVMLGYAFGFWGVIGVLVLKRNWRDAYFQFMDEAKDKIYATMMVNMAKLKRRMR